MRYALVFAAIATALGQSIEAQVVQQQSAFGLRRGSEVRFATDSLGSAGDSGRVLAVGADSFYLRRTLAGDSVGIAMRRLTSLEVRTTRAHKRAGAFVGVMTGGIVGFEIAHTNFHPKAIDELQSLRDGHEIEGTVEGALIGAVVGTITGALIRSERWQRIPLLRDYFSRPQRSE